MPTQRTEIVRPRGINKDLSPYELPPEVWSDGHNVTFRRNRTNKVKGYEDIFGLTYSASPLYHQYFTDGEQNQFIYASEGSVYTTNGDDDIQVGTGYSASREFPWTGCNLNGVTILNNRTNVPQVLNPETFTEMIDLPNWDATLDTELLDLITEEERTSLDIWGLASRASVIRPYKNYLFALDCWDKNGVRYPSMVRWSSPAESGDVPPSWNPNDPAEQAGLYVLADTPGRILDGKTLGDYFMIYKTDSVWTAQFIGGDFVFSFRKLFGAEEGALSAECIAEFDGKHFVLTEDGAYIHNGATKQEVMEKWVKDELFNNVDPTRKLEVKVVADHSNKEIWIYYTTPASPNGWADRALIWNFDIQEWSSRDLSGIAYIAEGRVTGDQVDLPEWDTTVGTWDAQTSYWDDGYRPLNSYPTKLLLSDYVNRKFYSNEEASTQLGVAFNGWVKRIGIDFNEDETFKYVTRIVPHLRNQTGTAAPVTVTVYAENQMTENPTEELSVVFDPGVDHSVDCHVVGRYIGIKFEGEELWDLTGYTIEWETAGTY